MRRALTCWVWWRGFPNDLVRSIELASYEAMANVAQHAYNGTEGELRLNATVRPDRLDIAVTDYGRWRNPQHKSDGGMGLTLIQRLADHAAINTTDGGTTVSMTWFHPEDSAPDYARRADL